MDGDPFLGGQDFTNCMLDNISSKIDSVCNKKWTRDARFVSYIKDQCDEAKIYLSDQDYYDFYLDIPPSLQKNRSSHCLEFKITRKEFEKMANELFERSMKPVMNVIQKVGRDPKKIDGLVLIGGSSYLPKIRNKLKEITQKDAFHGVCPVEAVAYGACTIAAKYLQGSMPEYIKNDPNIGEDEKFLSSMSVHDESAKEKLQYTIEIEKIKNNYAYYEPMIEEGVPLPFSKETLVYPNEVDIPKNSKTVYLRIFKNQNKTRTILGYVKFDIPKKDFHYQKEVPLINIRLELNKSGLFYATQNPTDRQWTPYEKLEDEKKKNLDEIRNEDITHVSRPTSEPLKNNGSNVHLYDQKQTSADYQTSNFSCHFYNSNPKQEQQTNEYNRRHETFPYYPFCQKS